MKYSLIFFILFFCATTAKVRGESYSTYRIDDSFVIEGKRRDLSGERRVQSVLKASGIEKQPDGFSYYSLNYSGVKFSSQKGEKTDRKSKNQIAFFASPEVTFLYSGNLGYCNFLVSPIVKYAETTQVNREISKNPDFEASGGCNLDSKNFSLSIESGRGFQRLDSFGLFFSGIVNFGSISLEIKNQNIFINFLGASFDFEDKKIVTSEKISNGNKLYGAGILFKKIQVIDWINFFAYSYHEPMQVARKEGFKFEREDFSPQGKFVYSGFELKTKPIEKFASSDIGFFSIHGYRDMGEYSNQKYNSKISTSSYLAYFQERLCFQNIIVKFGVLKSSKDKHSKTDRQSNGYFGLLTEPRIFGGRSSFLLNEGLGSLTGKFVFDSTENSKPNYENLGLQILNFGLSFPVISTLSASVIINHSISEIGIGKELIVMGQYNFQEDEKKSFLLFSACITRVQSRNKEKIFFEEIEKQADEKEYLRFYISGVLLF